MQLPGEAGEGVALRCARGRPLERCADLTGPFRVFPVQVCRRRGNRRMPQVVAHRYKLDPRMKRMRGMRMPQPVGADVPQFRGERRILGFHTVRRFPEKVPHHLAQPHRPDARLTGRSVRAMPARIMIGVQCPHQRRGRVPPRPPHRQAAGFQIHPERVARERRQGHAPQLLALAGHVEPPRATRIGADVAERGVDELVRAQAGGVAEIQHETQTLRGRHRPAAAFEPVGDGTHGFPLRTGERARRIERRAGSAAAHGHAGKRVKHHVVLAGEPREQRAQHRERVRGRARRQAARERPPSGGIARPRRPGPARGGDRMPQERPVRDRVVGREGRQRQPSLDERPQQQPFGLAPIRACGVRRLMQREPRFNRFDIVASGEPARLRGRPEASLRAVQFGGQ